MYEITEQRRLYLNARGFTTLTACPGSGKTTSIAYKLKNLIEECSQNIGAGVLCLSFTNKACDEIRSKYKEMHSISLSYPNEVSTIDSFVTHYIVLHYWYLIKGLAKPNIINEIEILHNLFFHQYKGKEYPSYDLREFIDLAYIYHPECVEYIGNHMYKYENKIVTKNDDHNLYNYCYAVVKYRLSHGILKSSEVMLIAIALLKKYSVIAKSLSKRFPYIILDEAQDTSETQFELIELLKSAGIKNIELVGDVNQALYEWRDARPEMFQKYTEMEGWNHLTLMENRRSVQRIIDFYSRLKPIGYPQIVSYGVLDKNIPIEVIRYDSGEENSAFNKFNEICKNNKLDSRLVLVRGESDLLKLTSVKKNVEPWKSKVPYRIIDTKLFYIQNKIKEALNKMAWICAYLIFGDNEFLKMKKYIQENKNTIDFNIMLLQILKSIPDLSLSFNEWDKKTRLLLKEILNLTTNVDFQFKKKMDGCKMNELRNQPVDTYFGLAEEHMVKAQTIHSAKGTSVDAVLLYLHDKSGAQIISFKDIPDDSNNIHKLKEKHRLIYVACSRARQFLAIAVPSSITNEQILSKFQDLEIHISSEGVQKVLDFQE